MSRTVNGAFDPTDVHQEVGRVGASAAATSAVARTYRTNGTADSNVGTADRELQVASDQPAVEEGKPLRSPGRPASQRDGRPDRLQGQPLYLPTPQPSDEPVVLADVLDELLARLQLHVVVSEHARVAVALWCARAHVMDYGSFAPRLHLCSPTKRCGKSTLLELMVPIVPRPLSTSSITPAAMFRVIEQASPTLFADEGDTYLPGNEELRGIVNSGHRRAQAYVIRCVGDHHEPRRFSTWAAIVIASIGPLPETIADRSIVIPMRRKLSTDAIEPVDDATCQALGNIGRKLARWADDHGAEVDSVGAPRPVGLNDRAADNWSTLLAIARQAGGRWPALAEVAARALSAAAADDDDTESLGICLLRDIRAIFDSRDVDLRATELTRALVQLPEAPWREVPGVGKPLTDTRLAGLLRPFGVRSHRTSAARLYRRADFADPFSRYLPPAIGDSAATATPRGAADPSSCHYVESINEESVNPTRHSEVGHDGLNQPTSPTNARHSDRMTGSDRDSGAGSQLIMTSDAPGECDEEFI